MKIWHIVAALETREEKEKSYGIMEAINKKENFHS